ncbi:hypothetical protein [Erythrobacter sp. KY5]|uniref:hypothetical protein n=1 Tax=Erythrobacter sp. KY5 TaxID=2011159 RepID=UPI0013A6A04A|nr:hypothetical protein [Erythrobacter sp. KY5]
MIRTHWPMKASLLAGAAMAALTGTSAHAAVDDYTIEAAGRVTINLDVCSAESQLVVRGDTGTDLDFVVTDAAGNNQHEDTGVDDYLSVVLEKQGDECETFALGVSNLGEEANAFVVVLEPITEGTTRVQKYIVQASETQTVSFKACGTSARVSARGDGDTDLDFVIRNANGGVVHENDDTTDETSTTLEGLLGDCEVFEMDIVNIGEVYNAVMLVVDPEGTSDTAFAGTQPTTSLASATQAAGSTARTSSTAETSGAGEYTADANASLKVNLPVCGATRLEVRGDGDTDLDFTINDEAGNVVHSDFDTSDVTFVLLSPSQECETFALEVDNLGDVYNVFTVALIDPEARASLQGPGEYRVSANAATKVALRVCSVTKVRARGDGDTDLDFDVTDSAGTSIHSDYDTTDATEFTLDPGSECGDFQMAVENLGDVYNMLTIDFGENDVLNAKAPERRGTMERGTPNRGALGAVKSTLAPPGQLVGTRRPAVSPDGQDRRLSILNQTGETLSEIYWSNSATLEWGYDRLGTGYTLSRDQQWNVTVQDGSSACIFDFKAVTENAREIELPAINVCEEESIVIE